MAYDEKLAGRLRKALRGAGTVSEKKMFGGIAFMLNGMRGYKRPPDGQGRAGSLLRRARKAARKADGFYKEADEGLRLRRAGRPTVG